MPMPPQRARRKRKTMDDDEDEDGDDGGEQFMARQIAPLKRRRCETIREDASAVVSSVSTTLSLPSSSSTTTTMPIARRNRKRTFNQLKQERDDGDNENDGDGDGDLVAELQDAPPRPLKRVRLQRVDTPTVHAQSCFDPIRLHNEHCPFVTAYQYNQQLQCVPGWKYCVQLLPDSVVYLKQLIDEQCASDRN
mmetsp:Transcript_40157/g.65905  ORF Transcript_40157/g.65905 Transcript_40157/m.65905 type:complete len:193 (+) Transcript_40157:2-580(+)